MVESPIVIGGPGMYLDNPEAAKKAYFEEWEKYYNERITADARFALILARPDISRIITR